VGEGGRCPFHEDRKASFGVNREGNYWHSFAGCGRGTIIDFWMKWRDINFSIAIRELSEIMGVEKRTTILIAF
jgi:DNA primase